MSSRSIREDVHALAWSLWSELGVAGLSREHSHVVLDPEPLIVATPSLVTEDPRLRDQVLGWCLAHSGRISASRLKGLLQASPPEVVERFGGLAAALARRSVRWPVVVSSTAWPDASKLKGPLPLQRSSLLRFRLRALCGVGARADVLAAMLGSGTAWLSTAELARQGYTKRNVALVVAELEAAGVLQARRDGAAVLYRLAEPKPLLELVGAEGVVVPAWQTILALTLDLLDLSKHEAAPSTLRRVEADAFRRRAAPLAQLLDLNAPPATRGAADAWETVLDWGTRQIQDLAAGTSSAFPRSRRAPAAYE